MTAHELIRVIEDAGGQLAIDGDRLRCRVPTSVEPLLDDLRVRRAEVLEVIQRRRLARLENIAPWLREHCIPDPAASSNPSILYREFCSANPKVVMAADDFLSILHAAGFHVDETGMIAGLCLVVDWQHAAHEVSQ